MPIASPTIPNLVKTFQPKVRICIEKSPYLIKTADTPVELEQAVALRTRVFCGELRGGYAPDELDYDEFDLNCDHLLVLDKASKQLVGTYRLICSTFSSTFYSASEFHIDALLQEKGIKLELGRACIDPAFRNGDVFIRLWNGIANYIYQTQADYIFGCSSVPIKDTTSPKPLQDYFHSKHYVFKTPSITPKLRAPAAVLASPSAALPDMSARAVLPPLLRWYLRLGARVAPEPALDPYFQCADFFTLMQTRLIPPVFHRRFGQF